MPTSGSAPGQDVACAAIIGALADVALGRPEAGLAKLVTEAYAALPPDIRTDIVSYEIRARVSEWH